MESFGSGNPDDWTPVCLRVARHMRVVFRTRTEDPFVVSPCRLRGFFSACTCVWLHPAPPPIPPAPLSAGHRKWKAPVWTGERLTTDRHVFWRMLYHWQRDTSLGEKLRSKISSSLHVGRGALLAPSGQTAEFFHLCPLWTSPMLRPVELVWRWTAGKRSSLWLLVLRCCVPSARLRGGGSRCVTLHGSGSFSVAVGGFCRTLPWLRLHGKWSSRYISASSSAKDWRLFT